MYGYLISDLCRDWDEDSMRFRKDLFNRIKVACFFNGYILTPYPDASFEKIYFRYKLFVVNAILVGPNGKVLATEPALPSLDTLQNHITRKLPLEYEPPLPTGPGSDLDSLLYLWRKLLPGGSLPEDSLCIDLEGRVATPGLIDSHMHISQWAKKLPLKRNDGEYENFGPFIDISTPNYYYDPPVAGDVRPIKKTPSQALAAIVEDIQPWIEMIEGQQYLTKRNGLNVHGFLFSEITIPDESVPSGETIVFMDHENYPLNISCVWEDGPDRWRLENGSSAVYPPVQIIHSSGQNSWCNLTLLREFNTILEVQSKHDREQQYFRGRLDQFPTPPSNNEISSPWFFEITGSSSHPQMEAGVPIQVPYPADVVLPPSVADKALELMYKDPEFCVVFGDLDLASLHSHFSGELHVPFIMEDVRWDGEELHGRPLIPKLADIAHRAYQAVIQEALSGHHDLTPRIGFELAYRPIAEEIGFEEWQKAKAISNYLFGTVEADSATGYGGWNPWRPHDTNWYNGADRGLMEYYRNSSEGKWKLTGRAEHYVMRDLLCSIFEPLSIEEGMQSIRTLAHWCHRHGITAAHDIMFYRRNTNLEEFKAYEGLTYAREADFYSSLGLDPSVKTGDLNLRVGLYYYLETAEQIDEVMKLAHNGETGESDIWRLMPHNTDHPEYPGWVEWLGWKLQMDGGTIPRTQFSNAPINKTERTGPPGDLSLNDHSYGLLTETNVQEPVFNSLESEILKKLAEEFPADCGFLNLGVTGLLDPSLNLDVPVANLAKKLETLGFATPSGIIQGKLTQLIKQTRDAFAKVLKSIAKIWVERERLWGDYSLPELPFQISCHCMGDGAVDLWLAAISRIKWELENPDFWVEANQDSLQQWFFATSSLPTVTPDKVYAGIRFYSFSDERYRVEHILNISQIAINLIKGPTGVDSASAAGTRNVVFSTQPTLLVLTGEDFRTTVFPDNQELWPIPSGISDFWLGISAIPRTEHIMPLRLYMNENADIPYALNTDPPSVRDPRPALTILGAVARTPSEINPFDWLDRLDGEDTPSVKPADYLLSFVFAGMGIINSDQNPMQISIEEALCSMTLWGAYVGRRAYFLQRLTPQEIEQLNSEQISMISQDKEFGSLAVGRYADLVVWDQNPLAFNNDMQLFGRSPREGQEDKLNYINRFIRAFRPILTVVGGKLVYARFPTEWTF